ncbi:MAG: hypothetical protein LBU32_03155 [Clostridiales bacterium]|nr:hypothetical protein [Clostridiales bacterium]
MRHGNGSGLILNGSLYAEATGMVGEIGHWRINGCGSEAYGKSGSFEGMCNGAGITAAAGDY